MKKHHPLAIIGAGPAGMAAAATAASHGITPLLIDEQPAPGGQIYRAIESTPLLDQQLLGTDYWEGARLVAELRGGNIDYRPNHVVWQLTKNGEIGVKHDEKTYLLEADRIILATGAQERPVPVQGWTLPGAMGAGAGQLLLKASGLVPQSPVVLAGSGPLLYLVAAQYCRVGAPISIILETTPLDNYRQSLFQVSGAFQGYGYLKKGLGLRKEIKRAGVRHVTGVTALHAEGEGRVERVHWQSRRTGKHWQSLPTTTLLLHQGVVPNIQITRALGATHHWNELQHCWHPQVDDWGACDIPNIYVAGDGCGIGGAKAAELRGQISGLAVLASLGNIRVETREREAAPLRSQLQREMAIRPFLDTLYKPSSAWRRPPDDVVVCRCEEVTAGEIRKVARLGCNGPNQMKSFTRCGMGPCQGRMCGLTVSEILAAELNRPMQKIGYYRLRPPFKPITLRELATADHAADNPTDAGAATVATQDNEH